MRSLLALFALASATAAQGVLPLSATMRFGGLRASFDGGCGFQTIPTVAADDGTLTFQQDGRFSMTVQGYEICPGGTSSFGPVEYGTGTYEVGSDGMLRLEWLPNSPGADPDTLFLRADGAVLTRSRKSTQSSDASLIVGIALSSGHDVRSLFGPYHVVRLAQRNPATGFYTTGDVGTLAFDGAGGYLDQGTRTTLPWGGTSTTESYGPNNGTYTVAWDGSMTTGAGASGAMSDDGEMFYLVRRVGQTVSLTIGMRQATNAAASLVSGGYRLAGMADAIEASVMPGELRTEWGVLRAQANSASGGMFDLDELRVGSSPWQTTSTQITRRGSFAITQEGALTLFADGNPPMPGAVSPDGSVAVALTIPGDGLGLTVGLAECAFPTPLGTGSPGTGGAVPAVLSLGGFPYTGNTGLALVVTNGLGGASAALAFGQPAAAGWPLLGGTLWLDPAQAIVSLPLLLSGPAGVAQVGAAGQPIPVPANPLLAGTQFASQAFVIDAAAPSGIAMSAALLVRIGR